MREVARDRVNVWGGFKTFLGDGVRLECLSLVRIKDAEMIQVTNCKYVEFWNMNRSVEYLWEYFLEEIEYEYLMLDTKKMFNFRNKFSFEI